MSFRREKYIPRGGPDGGNGGHGGSVYLRAASGLNTLADFRVQRRFRALNGEPGAGQNRTGLSGEELFVDVPVGTIVKEVDTQEILGDLDGDGNVLLVARGGRGGLGNTRFKSSVNRAPRQSTPGEVGEARHLALELKVLADVGLVGMPNAGKSTLIRALSAARPKVADYPFTTLHPHLGVVRVEDHRSFVMADIPGLIQGAAEGAGLGHQFLRHLERTRLLLHLVDAYPLEGGGDPSTEARAIEAELSKFSEQLGNQPRWLVLNKLDLFPEDEQQSAADDIVQQLGWTGPVYGISALTGDGTTQLAQDVMVFLESAHMAEEDV